jgi:hypothetical protein
MKICFVGDLFLGGDLDKKHCKGLVKSNLFGRADLRIANLEQPISDSTKIENKCTLYTGSFAIKQLKELGVDAVSIAHNHIQDKGEQGIVETSYHLEIGKIGYFGAGKDFKNAKSHYWLTKDLAVLSYCDFAKPYLKQVKLAQDNSPGVAPLRYEFILRDLEELPAGKKAILFFHWGREHVWFPPYEDITIARKLLADDRVALIVGSHAHRALGFVEYKGKRAYMCLGNFLFPNFYISPPTQICYPASVPEKVLTTRQYHSVNEITYKKWKTVNRISMLLEYDTATDSVKHSFVMQEDNFPVVKDLNRAIAILMNIFIHGLSIIYTAPRFIYLPIEKVSTFIIYKIWKAKILLFHMRREGVKYVLGKILKKISILKNSV